MKDFNNKKLIKQTKQEFSSYQQEELSDLDACEIVSNFSGFAKLFLSIDKRKQDLQKG